jgi:hypothetical protein
VPEWLESPYNDHTQYGISPGWGYGTILESTVPALKAGSVLWGFFPISTFPVDLLLQQSAELETHFIEVSPHRAKVMPLYQRYISVSGTVDEANPAAPWKAMLKPVWEAGYLYNRFNFASEPDYPRIHPGIGNSWTESDANLKEALVICLGAGSKTSRSFEHQLATNRALGSGPVAVLEVSSSLSGSSPFGSHQPPFSHKKTTYADLQSPALSDWLFGQPISKFVIIDFAGRTGVCESLATQLRTNPAGIPVEVFFVGTEAKMYTTNDLAERAAMIARLDAVRCNTSKVRQGAIDKIGEAKYFKDLDHAFDNVLNDGVGDRVLGVSLEVRKGLQGDDGIERAWETFCGGKVNGDEGMAFWL